MSEIYALTQIQSTANWLIANMLYKNLAFQGPMGSGKTTLIKAILKELKAVDAGNSPSFGIVNEYHNEQGQVLAYHLDFYRLEDETEALDMGLEDYLAQDVWIFMEWPERIASLLPQETTFIRLGVRDENTRQLTMGKDFM